MRDSDLAAMRAMVGELLTATVTLEHATRVSNAWGEAERSATQILELPCAYGERMRLIASGAGVGPLAQQSLLVPYDAPVEIGDTVRSVRGPGTDQLPITGRVARVVRTPVVTLVELGGE